MGGQQEVFPSTSTSTARTASAAPNVSSVPVTAAPTAPFVGNDEVTKPSLPTPRPNNNVALSLAVIVLVMAIAAVLVNRLAF